MLCVLITSCKLSYNERAVNQICTLILEKEIKYAHKYFRFHIMFIFFIIYYLFYFIK